MASSRHLKGSVLTRVRDLLKSGVLKNKPVWYDVMTTFPPLAEADLQRKLEYGQVERIVYPEDAIRRKFFSSYELEPISLNESSVTETTCDRFVAKCLEMIEDGVSENEAFHKTAMVFDNELTEKKSAPFSKRTRPEAKEPPKTLHDLFNIDDSDSRRDK